MILKSGFSFGLDEKSDIIITFDDGYKNFLDIFPFLTEKGIKVIIFISVNKIGKIIYEDDYGCEKEYLSLKDIFMLEKSGFVKFYNHGYNHINFFDNNFKITKKDIILSNKFFIDNKKNCKDFCFPYGFFKNSDVIFLLKLGYKRLYTTKTGFNYKKDFLIKRFAPKNLGEMKKILKEYEKNK